MSERLLVNANATSEWINWPGGRGSFEVVAAGFGTVTLEYLASDDITAVAMGIDTTLTANGGGVFTIGACKIRAAVSGAVGVYAIVHRAK